MRLYNKDDEPATKLQLLPHKHDIITLLGVGGHWITTEENLQVPSEARGCSCHTEKCRLPSPGVYIGTHSELHCIFREV